MTLDLFDEIASEAAQRAEGGRLRSGPRLAPPEPPAASAGPVHAEFSLEQAMALLPGRAKEWEVLLLRHPDSQVRMTTSLSYTGMLVEDLVVSLEEAWSLYHDGTIMRGCVRAPPPPTRKIFMSIGQLRRLALATPMAIAAGSNALWGCYRFGGDDLGSEAVLADLARMEARR